MAEYDIDVKEWTDIADDDIRPKLNLAMLNPKRLLIVPMLLLSL
jgi:hypothetical protein